MSRRFSSLVLAAPIWLAMAFLASPAAEAAVPVLELHDRGSAVLSLQNAKPGDSTSGCLRLVYRGSKPARVLLYGATSGTGFDRYLEMRVERGASCNGGRRKLVFDGTLQDFPDAPGGAIEETWSPDESHAYRFEIAVRDDNAAQGLTARQTFTWTTDGQLAHPPDRETETETPAGTPAGTLAQPPGLDGLRKVLLKIAQVAAEVGKRSAFPTGLLVLVVIFLGLQNRIDRRDPKLALAPVHPTPDLPFGDLDDEGGSS
jgi:hypothetical protein